MVDLTERHRLILSLIAQGKSSKQIAADLGVSLYTIETHRKTIMMRLGARNMAHMVYLATKQGLV